MCGLLLISLLNVMILRIISMQTETLTNSIITSSLPSPPSECLLGLLSLSSTSPPDLSPCCSCCLSCCILWWSTTPCTSLLWYTRKLRWHLVHRLVALFSREFNPRSRNFDSALNIVTKLCTCFSKTLTKSTLTLWRLSDCTNFSNETFQIKKMQQALVLAQYLIFVDIKTLVDQDKIFFWEDFVVFHNNLEVCHIYNSEAEGEIWLTFNLAGLLIYFPKPTQQCNGFVRQSY